MKLTDKLRSAAKSPNDWDISGLLEDAAKMVDALLHACKAAHKEYCKTTELGVVPVLLKETIAHAEKH